MKLEIFENKPSARIALRGSLKAVSRRSLTQEIALARGVVNLQQQVDMMLANEVESSSFA